MSRGLIRASKEREMLDGRRIMGAFLENGACRQLHVPIDGFSEHVSRVKALVRLAFNPVRR
jgi:hypothetical protein